MKLARFLLNTLLFIVTFAIILCAQYGVTALFTLQAGEDVDRVQIFSSDDDVSYIDAPGFLIEDLKMGYQTEEVYWIRSWFDNDEGNNWWARNMRWADIGLSKIVVTGKAIIMPVSDIKDLRDTHIPEFTEEWHEFYNWVNILESDAYKIWAGIDPSLTDDEIGALAAEYNNPDSTIYRDYLNAKGNLINMTEDEWMACKDHSEEIQFIRLARHYNTPTMHNYYNKFVNESNVVKFSAVTLYIHLLIAILVAAWFLRNNSFKIRRDEENDDNVVEGGYKLFPGFGSRKKRKNRKKKKSEE